MKKSNCNIKKIKQGWKIFQVITINPSSGCLMDTGWSGHTIFPNTFYGIHAILCKGLQQPSAQAGKSTCIFRNLDHHTYYLPI